jgi:cellulose synthase/poly-beta-1,6-N-acetylglucosamine synthase-like glycosyltransferase
MSPEPFVSIVVPTTGTVGYIRGMVESVARLDYPRDRFELILLGDAETPLLQRARELAQKGGVALQVLHGPVATGEKRNRGVAAAQGEFIAFTDDDTILREDWLRAAVKHLAQKPDYAGVGGPNYTPREGLPFSKAVGRIFGSKFLFRFRYTTGHDKPCEVDHNPTCNYVLRREAVAGVGFHPTLWPGEDVEFDIRLQQAGHRILYAPDVVVWHHRRSRPLAFLRQMFNYGVTRAQVTRMHPGSFDPRHYAFISAFVVLASLYGLAWQQPTVVPWLLPAALNATYFGVLGLAGLLVGAQTRSFKQTLYAPLVLFIQHFGYSLGLLVGLLRRP